MTNPVRPPKPSQLPSSFRPTLVEWKPVELPAPTRAAAYAGAQLEKRLAKPAKPSQRLKPPRLPGGKTAHGTVELQPAHTKVMLCESDEATRTLVDECLRHWGFQVTSFAGAEEAAAAFDAGEVPHVLVTGGGSSAVELARRFVRAVPEMEVVLLGAGSEITLALDMRGTKMHEFVLKPIVRTEDLRAATANACLRVHQGLYAKFLVAEFEKMNRRQEIEARVAAELSERTELSKTLEIGCRGLSELFDDAAVAFLQYVPAQRALVASARFPQDLFAGGQPKIMLPRNVGADAASVRAFLGEIAGNAEFRAAMQAAAEMSPELLARWGGAEWRTATLETRGIPRGVVAVLAPNGNERADGLRLQRVVQQLAQSYEIALLHAKLGESSIQDSFTGLANDRYFGRRLKEEILKATRLVHPLSLLVFTRVSATDAQGDVGAAGAQMPRDQYLRLLSKITNANFRQTDLQAFRGKEQFSVVLPHTSFVDALKKAERFRQQAAELSNGQLQVAVGVAEYPGHAATAEELLFAAESACQEAARLSAGTAIQIAEAREGYVPPYLPDTPRTAHTKKKPSEVSGA